jgi:hypothetical protein
MSKKKLSLEDLQLKSFVTEASSPQVARQVGGVQNTEYFGCTRYDCEPACLDSSPLNCDFITQTGCSNQITTPPDCF